MEDQPFCKYEILDYFINFLKPDLLETKFVEFCKLEYFVINEYCINYKIDYDNRSISYLKEGLDYPTAEIAYFADFLMNELLEAETRCWKAFNLAMEKITTYEDKKTFIIIIESDLKNILKKLKAKENSDKEDLLVESTLESLMTRISEFPILNYRIEHESQDTINITKLKWNGHPDLFFLLFASLIEENLLECIDEKTTQVKIAEWLSDHFELPISKRTHKNLSRSTIIQYLIPKNNRFDKYMILGDLKKEYIDYINSIKLKIK